MIKKCKICGNEFILPKTLGGNNQLCCSDECKRINNNLLKRESFLRLKEKKNKIITDYSNKYKIPKRYVLSYGIDFLNENTTVRDSLHLITKISGKYTFLTEEEKEIRRSLVAKEANNRGNGKIKKLRKEKGYTKKICKVCGKEFSTGSGKKANNRVTCSDVCSKELHRIQSNEASQRQRDKNKLKPKNK